MSKQSKRNAAKPICGYDNAVSFRRSLIVPTSEFIPSGVIDTIRRIEKQKAERERKLQDAQEEKEFWQKRIDYYKRRLELYAAHDALRKAVGNVPPIQAFIRDDEIIWWKNKG